MIGHLNCLAIVQRNLTNIPFIREFGCLTKPSGALIQLFPTQLFSVLCDIIRKEANCANCREMNRRWICTDVWMDIFPHFDHAHLGLKLALLSDRFDILVDKHFDGKSELTIWSKIKICKAIDAEMPTMSVSINNYANSIQFSLPDHSLPNKIRFNDLLICYIDHSVLAFLRANQQIWDKGTNLHLDVVRNNNSNIAQPICDVLPREIWPIFVPNIRRLSFFVTDLDKLRRRISPTILTDLKRLNSICSWDLLPDVIGYDGQNATAGQALAKWLHTPGKDGKPKRLRCFGFQDPSINIDQWINNFKEAFLRATTSSSSHILSLFVSESAQIMPFELVNERTREKLTLEKEPNHNWLLKRCQIGQIVQWKDGNLTDNLNNVIIRLGGNINWIGPLSPPTADQNNE